MARIHLKKRDFGIFFQELLKRCYGKDFDPSKFSKESLFGYNNAINSKDSIRGLIETAIRKKINGRELSKAVDAFQGMPDDARIDLPETVLRPCLDFLGFEEVSELVTDFFEKHQVDEATYQTPSVLIPQESLSKSLRSSGFRANIDEKLANLANTTWHYYTHYSKSTTGNYYSPQILRLPLKIYSKLANGDYEIELSQQLPYTTFAGRIVRNYSGDNILVCELSSKGKTVDKRLYMYIHVNLDATGDLFVGSFMRYTDGASIYTGTFVMEKLDEFQDADLEPKIFDYFESVPDQPKRVVQKFLYDRRLNLLRLPTGLFTEMDFNQWLQNMENTQENPMPEIDLFIGAPVKGFDKSLTDKSFDFERVKSPKTLEDLRGQIINLIKDLKSKNEGFDNIWYSPAEENFLEKKNLDPNYLLEMQLKHFRKSKRILILLPFPSITSTLLEAGWTMMIDSAKPVFICYSQREDLPFLLQKADTLYRRIYLISLRKIGGIAGIPDWIINNEYHKL